MYGILVVAALLGYYLFLQLYESTYAGDFPGVVFLVVAASAGAGAALFLRAGDAGPRAPEDSEAPPDDKSPLVAHLAVDDKADLP